MRIHKVFSNKESFKEVNFKDGFNIIYADKVSDSSDGDSRNGLGKTMLLNIINYCLGSGLPKKLDKDELKDWTFGINIELNGKEYSIQRKIITPNYVYVEGDVSNWQHKPEETSADEIHEFKIDNYNEILGRLIFDVNTSSFDDLKYVPSFRNLMSYFTRTDVVAFNDPFRHFSRQPTWSIQVANGYLLGLNWRDAARLQEILKQKDVFAKLKSASKEGILDGFTGSVGELESEEVRLNSSYKTVETKLASFQVHEQYYEVQTEANELTATVHGLLNKINLNEQILTKYRESFLAEKDLSPQEVEGLYSQVGVNFNDTIVRKLDEVQSFHQQIIENRKEYLQEEVEKLEKSIKEAKKEIEQLSTKKADLMLILESHGALEEYSNLQNRATKMKHQIEEIRSSIQRINDFNNRLSDIKVSIEELLKNLRLDYQERKSVVSDAIEAFNSNSQYLYSQSGILAIDVTDNGYKFNVDIKRADSDGISNMKVFCYDLTLVELWKKHHDKSMLIFHDSKIFGDVDERQIAKSLKLAQMKTEELGFQYICSINSDQVPRSEFDEDFSQIFDSSIVLKLTDKGNEGNLLGVSF